MKIYGNTEYIQGVKYAAKITKDILPDIKKPVIDINSEYYKPNYDINKGFDSSINYSKLRTITPELNDKIWEAIDKDMLKEMQMFIHNIQKIMEYRYGCINVEEHGRFNPPNEALGEKVEYFGPWATADARIRYISLHIADNPNMTLIDKVGNSLISHFYGPDDIHQTITGETDPAKAYLNFKRLADEQLEFKKTSRVGEYTKWLRVFTEKQKRKGKKFWSTSELHTSLQTAGRRFVNEWYLNDRMNAHKGTTANVAEWVASWNNDGQISKMIETASIKETTHLVGENWGIGEYYMIHAGHDITYCPEVTGFIDERFIIAGPGAKWLLDKLYPNTKLKDISYADRIIWFREHQHELFNLPEIDKFFHNIKGMQGNNIFPESINEIKVAQAEVCHCQFGIYIQIKDDKKKIERRKAEYLYETTSNTCLIDRKYFPDYIHKDKENGELDEW